MSDLIGIICVLIGAGVLIRTACFVMSADIWFDELFTVELALKPMGEMIELAARDVHPPLYYILVRVVYIILNSAFGTDVTVAAKITSILPYAGVCIYLMTRVRKRYGLTAAGIAFVLIMTMPHMSEYMVEARMYSWCAFCLLAMYIHAVEYAGLTAMADEAVRGRRIVHASCMLIYGVGAMYLHYYGLIGAGIIALGTCVSSFIICRREARALARCDRKKVYMPVVCAVACTAAALAAYIPWMKVLSAQVGQVSESYWIQPVTVRTLAGSVKYIFMPSFESGIFSMICALVMIAGYLWLMSGYIRRHTGGSTSGDEKSRISPVILSAVLPAALVLAGFTASLIIRPVFVYRYMFPAMFVFWTGTGVLISDGICHVTEGHDNAQDGRGRRIVSVCLLCVICAAYICAGIRSYNLFRWEEMKKAEGMKRCEEVFEQIEADCPDTLIVCNFNQMQAVLWHYLDNDSVLWGYTGETLIAEICGRSPVVMIEDPEELKSLLRERGQSEFLFFGSGNARDEIIDEWESFGFFTELLQDSCFLERYYANIYKVGFER